MAYTDKDREYQKRYREKNREAVRMRKKAEYETKREHYLEYKKQWREENREKTITQQQQWFKENKEHVVSYRRQYYEDHKGAYIARNALRIEHIRQATPKWADLTKIREFYEMCPKGFHVDHIIPLRGENVCGFHIETNLQYLTARENIVKGNKVWQ